MTTETYNIAKELVDTKNTLLKRISQNQKVIKTLKTFIDNDKDDESWFSIWDGQFCYYTPKVMLKALTEQNLVFGKKMEKIEEELADL